VPGGAHGEGIRVRGGMKKREILTGLSAYTRSGDIVTRVKALLRQAAKGKLRGYTKSEKQQASARRNALIAAKARRTEVAELAEREGISRQAAWWRLRKSTGKPRGRPRKTKTGLGT